MAQHSQPRSLLMILSRIAVVSFLASFVVSHPSGGREESLTARASSPAEEFLGLFTDSLLPRVQALRKSASVLSSDASASRIYETINLLNEVSKFENGTIRSYLPSFWTTKFTDEQGTEFVATVNEIADEMSTALLKVSAAAPGVASLPLVQRRPLVLTTRISLNSLYYPISETIDLMLEWYPAMPNDQLTSSLKAAHTRLTQTFSIGWAGQGLPLPNGVDVTPNLEPWQDPVARTLSVAVEASANLKKVVQALNSASSPSDFRGAIGVDPLAYLYLLYPDQHDLLSNKTTSALQGWISAITSDVAKAYSILRDEKYPLIEKFGKKDRTDILQDLAYAASRNGFSFGANFISWILKLVQPKDNIKPAIKKVIENFEAQMKELERFALNHI